MAIEAMVKETLKCRCKILRARIKTGIRRQTCSTFSCAKVMSISMPVYLIPKERWY